MSTELQARIKPHDPKRGHVAKTRTFSVLGGLKFEEGRVYKLSETQAEVLKDVRMIDGDESTPLLFDILPADEMLELLQAEAAKKLDMPGAGFEAVKPTRLAGDDDGKPAKPKRVERTTPKG